jgi:hypothetical protein
MRHAPHAYALASWQHASCGSHAAPPLSVAATQARLDEEAGERRLLEVQATQLQRDHRAANALVQDLNRQVLQRRKSRES